MTRYNPTIPITKTTPSHYKYFSCGESALDEYIKRFAVRHEKRGIARTFILPSEGRVVGYYTLCAAQVFCHELPEAYRSNLPRYPIPASRLCRLAVNNEWKGKRVGEYLLMDAVKRVLDVDKSMAIHSLIVDAKVGSKNFYLKYDFLPLHDKELNLFLPLATLKKALSDSLQLESLPQV